MTGSGITDWPRCFGPVVKLHIMVKMCEHQNGKNEEKKRPRAPQSASKACLRS